MVNCAAVMALDLGLGRRPAPNVVMPAFQRYHPDSGSIEARRTFLVCYYLCMSITMILRRPILLRWTKYMEESIAMLESDEGALPSDKILVQHVRLAHIGEEMSVQFSLDDPSSMLSVSDPNVSFALRCFENNLQAVRDRNAQLPHDREYFSLFL